MVFVLDDRYLALSAIVCVGWQFFFYLIAAGFKFDKVTDLAYGTNFMALAILTFFLNETYYARQIVITILVTIWGLRLAAYLFIRIIKIGSDKRFDGAREDPIKFGIWFFFQAVVVWVIALPYVILNSKNTNPSISAADIVGWTLFGIGFFFEAVSDQQKFSYRNDKNNDNHWCDVGLWKSSRHPNYFGEILIWIGIFVSCARQLTDYEWFAIASPLIIIIVLMFGSGVPTTEKSTDKRFGQREDYIRYKKRTPVLVPFIPGIFGGIAKAIFCCEWPIYNYQNDEREKINSGPDNA